MQDSAGTVRYFEYKLNTTNDDGLTRPAKTNEQHRLAAGARRVGYASPYECREQLGSREAGVQNAGLARDDGIREVRVEPFQLVEHVGLEDVRSEQ